MRHLIHDHAWRGASRVVALIRHLLREEEIVDAHGEYYALLCELLSGFQTALDRQRARLDPLAGKGADEG